MGAVILVFVSLLTASNRFAGLLFLGGDGFGHAADLRLAAIGDIEVNAELPAGKV